MRHCEDWAATLLEGQLSFPMLAFYRSHHHNQSWLAALCAIMDACALLLMGIEGARSFQPSMTFAMGRMVILEMMNILRLQPMNAVDQLPASGFDDLSATLQSANLLWREAGAEPRPPKLRSTYEPYLYAISQYLVLPLPGWVPSADHDN